MEEQAIYVRTWRGKGIADGAKDLGMIIEQLEYEIAELKQMHKDGITLDGPVEDDYGTLITEDSELAGKHDLWIDQDEEPEI